MLKRALASQRSFLGVGVVLVSLLALLPLAALLLVASRSGWAGLLALGCCSEEIRSRLPEQLVLQVRGPMVPEMHRTSAGLDLAAGRYRWIGALCV